MDWIQLKQLAAEWIKKYRLAVIGILAGLLLLSMPRSVPKEPSQTPAPEQPREQTLQQQLEEMLSRVDGAGRVKVLLTAASGQRIHYQTDEDSSYTADSGDLRKETVLITGTSREQTGLVQRIDPPVYMGAVVLCQGADRASVRLALTDAVKTATGLTADKISILKMK